MDVQQHRDWLLSLFQIPEDAQVLDVGCGNGADLIALATRTPDPSARFLGLDAQEKKIAAARGATDDPRIDFRIEKVESTLPFEDGSFDLVLTQELLECLADPASLVDEIARVLKPGGFVVASHYDWDTQLFNASDRDRTRRVLRAWADCELSTMDHADPWMGRRLWGLFHPSPDFEGEVRSRVMSNTEFTEPYHGFRMAHWMKSLVKRGLVSQEDYDGFMADLEEAANSGRYFWSVNRYVYVGRRKAS
jgi:SAM-dependent methyltransferase